MVLLNISPYPPAQALLLVSSVAVCSVILIYTRNRRELWARRVKQASLLNGLVAVGIVLFWVTYWFANPVLLPFIHLFEELGVMAAFAAVAWHVGTNLTFSANKYYFTVLCKSCTPLLAVGLISATIIAIRQPIPMMGVQELPVEAFVYRAALLIPGIFATALILIGFGSEYLSESTAERTRKKRQLWFTAGALVWLVLTCQHFVFSYLNVFEYELLTAPTMFSALIGFEALLYVLMATTWIRAITVDISEKSEIQERMEADMRAQIHEISRRRKYVDLVDVYPDWAVRAERLMLAVNLHSLKRGYSAQLEAALAVFADIHLRSLQASSKLSSRMAHLVDEQRTEISAVSGLSYGSMESHDIVDVVVCGEGEVDLTLDPPYIQLAMIAAAYEELLSDPQAIGVLDGKLVDPYLVKVYRVAMDGISTKTGAV